jgi:hypothetical protein
MKRALIAIKEWWNRNKILKQENQILKNKLVQRDRQLIMASINYSSVKDRLSEAQQELIVKELHIALLKK